MSHYDTERQQILDILNGLTPITEDVGDNPYDPDLNGPTVGDGNGDNPIDPDLNGPVIDEDDTEVNPFIFSNRISWNEIPVGTIDGVNTDFELAQSPRASNMMMVYLNGLLQKEGSSNDFTVVDTIITFNTESIPQTNDDVRVTYAF